ncbi:MAG: heme exporter protein CcmD [Sneathiella sp.]|nr:heme exporter protein CcmD [Sneathiella sp.]
MTAFFDMGGYGLFVWPSFAISAVVLIVLYARSQSRLKSVERELAAAQDGRPRRAGSGAGELSGESLT